MSLPHELITTLAALVRLHEGNRDPKINALLDEADLLAPAVAELIEAADEASVALGKSMQHTDELCSHMRLCAALARVHPMTREHQADDGKLSFGDDE